MSSPKGAAEVIAALLAQAGLAGGALAFEQGRMGVDQILAQRPER
jgi:hypothetical protein